MQLTTKSYLALTVAIIARLGHLHLSIPVKGKKGGGLPKRTLGLKAGSEYNGSLSFHR
jgi:hypothetical protein